MLDRESTFAHTGIVELLKDSFVPTAIDQAYQRRQKDTEGEFFRKIAAQSPRNDFSQTTQGFYVATPSGKLLLYNNNRDPQKVFRLMRDALQQYESEREQGGAIESLPRKSVDKRFNPVPPEGGLIVRVRAKVLEGYEPTENRWRKIFQSALSRDNLWITKAEHQELVQGRVPEALVTRIARFHLVDNTRGEPPMWSKEQIRSASMRLDGQRLTGNVHLETNDGQRGYQAKILGRVEVEDQSVNRFDLVVVGEFWGEGRFTGKAPEGRFPLAIALELADGSDIADQVPPQGSRGWIDGYLK